MAHRSDRRGVEPITSLCFLSRAQSIGSPRATFHRGQDDLVPSTIGPEIRLQSTFCCRVSLAVVPGGVQIRLLGCWRAYDAEPSSPNSGPQLRTRKTLLDS